jgi:hypothetical protein
MPKPPTSSSIPQVPEQYLRGAKKTTVAAGPSNVIEVDGIRFDLKNRSLAALLAWLVPGAGHYYQGRRTKAAMFLFTILTTYLAGFVIGGRHVVYASWVPGDRRWHFACQLGAGVLAMPALVQGNLMRKSTDERGWTRPGYEPYWGGLMAPPRRPVEEETADDVAAWYARMGAGYEMGTWYTMIAGLLNILVIYDAFAGPLSTPISGRKPLDEPEKPADPGTTGDA